MSAREAALAAHEEHERARHEETDRQRKERLEFADARIQKMIERSILPELFPGVEWEVVRDDVELVDAVVTPLPERDFELGISQLRPERNQGWIGSASAPEAVKYPARCKGYCDCSRRMKDDSFVFVPDHKHYHDSATFGCARCGCDGFTFTIVHAGYVVTYQDDDDDEDRWVGNEAWSLAAIGESILSQQRIEERRAAREAEQDPREDEEDDGPTG